MIIANEEEKDDDCWMLMFNYITIPIVVVVNFFFLFKNCQSAILCFVFVFFLCFLRSSFTAIMMPMFNDHYRHQWFLCCITLHFYSWWSFIFTIQQKTKQSKTKRRVAHCPIIFSILMMMMFDDWFDWILNGFFLTTFFGYLIHRWY